MMRNWFRSVSGTTRVRVRCAQPERFFNLCAKAGIPMRDPACPNPRTAAVTIPAPKLPEAEALAARCGGVIEAGPVRGLPRLRHLARRRRLVLFLLAVAAALALFSSAFLWEIRVTGNETVPTGVILRALDEIGFSTGKCWLWMQSQALQSELICRLPQLEWASFQIRGSRADVIVYEAEDSPEILRNDEPVDLVAARGGIIMRMTVLQGQPAAERGGFVLPGQLLVSGMVDDRLGGVRTAHALGSVRARTEYEITACLPREIVCAEAAGRSRSRWALVFGKKRINFYQSSGIPDGECDTIYHEYVCAVPGVFRLPVSLWREECRPVRTERRERSASEAYALLEQALRRALASCLGTDGEIVSQHFSRGETDAAYLLTLRAECEQEIATERKHANDRTNDTGRPD